MKTAAFFDMDGTILSVNTAAEYLRLLRREGRLPTKLLLQGISWLLQYKIGHIDAQEVSKQAVSVLCGNSEADLRARSEAWFLRDIQHTIRETARQRIEEHRAKGHMLVMLTAATPYIAWPLCEALQIPHLLCTRLETQDGMFTGKPLYPLCFGEGKVLHAEQLAEKHGLSLQQSYFYTDSINDRQMLERVKYPIVVNPDLRLRLLGLQRGWRYEDWR